MENEDLIYRKLQEHLDKLPVGFPPTESGVEIRILKHLFTLEDAELALNLGTAFPEKLNSIFRRMRDTGISKEELEKKLNKMVKKGLIQGGETVKMLGYGKSYSCAPFIVGIFEYQANRLTKEFFKDYKEYLHGQYLEEYLNPNTPFQFRTIPVEKSISIYQSISNYDDVKLLIENANGPFGVTNCICKQGMDILGKPCTHTDLRETCISINEGAVQGLQVGYVREINKNEAIGILRKAQDAGLVLMPGNSQNPLFICTCCGDCCQILTSLKKMPKPVDFIESNYFAAVNEELCEACETCIERCKMEALTITDGRASVDLDRCIGCGNCVSTCPSNAIQLIKKEKEIVPPKDIIDLYIQLIKSKS